MQECEQVKSKDRGGKVVCFFRAFSFFLPLGKDTTLDDDLQRGISSEERETRREIERECVCECVSVVCVSVSRCNQPASFESSTASKTPWASAAESTTCSMYVAAHVRAEHRRGSAAGSAGAATLRGRTLFLCVCVCVCACV